MGTFKRTPFEIDTTVRNGSKYLNQMQFNGIVQNNNTFDVDQNSLTDALNVYVNEQNTLVSREPLIKDSIEIDYPTETAQLIDIKECNGVKVFVFKDSEKYTITAHKGKTSKSLTDITQYYITIFNQYIICWNNLGAKVIDTSNTTIYWDDLDKHIEVPITEITSGSRTIKNTDNQLTGDYIHRYNRTGEFETLLPEYDTNKVSVTAELITSAGTTKYSTNTYKMYKFPEYRFLKQLQITPKGTYYIDANDDEEVKDEILAAQNVVIIARIGHFLVSYDYGETFTSVSYPTTFVRHNSDGDNYYSTVVDFPNDLKAISEDGQAFFYGTDSGIYRCLLSDYSWTKFTYHNMSMTTEKNALDLSMYHTVHFTEKYHFKNADVFCFTAGNTQDGVFVYYLGPGMNDTTTSAYSNTLCRYQISSATNLANNSYYKKFVSLAKNRSVKIDVNMNGNGYLVYSKDDGNYNNIQNRNYVTTSLLAVIGKGTTTACKVYEAINTPTIYCDTMKPYGQTCETVEYLSTYNNYSVDAVRITGVVGSLNGFVDSAGNSISGTCTYEVIFGNSKDTSLGTANCNLFKYYTITQICQYYTNIGFPILLSDNLYIGAGKGTPLLMDINELQSLIEYEGDFPSYDEYCYHLIFPSGISGSSEVKIAGQILYAYCNEYSKTSDNFICTNKLLAKEIVQVDYKYNSDKVFSKIPTISYSDAEMFLAFDNTLMITKNEKDGEKILFKLPKEYNQSFTNNIKAIINISTTELALFFENGISICSQISNDVLGYTYSITKTRLTSGTKFGDSVINTADGASTLYATPRGLAIMNYQAYMATTDQTLQFVSDKIYAIWNKFYLNSENITLVQHGDYVFVYNTSNQYLMLDLRNYSWWKFEIPFNIKKLLTDQIDLRLISDNLYKFKRVNNDTDKIEDDYIDDKYYDVDNEPIRWMFMSQRLHFNLPNHYKNMKQLVFHMIQSTGHISTFNAQVKLYRNSVNYKDMEVIPFDFNFAVDEFRTFVKRFNYWKINLLQYGVANDDKAAVPARLVCNGIDIKYEIGDEVR